MVGSQPSKELKCDTAMDFVIHPFDPGFWLEINYDTESNFCGGGVYGSHGTINMGVLTGTVECEWNAGNDEGNSIEIKVGESYIESSPYCAQSFLELRADNRSGPLITRRCGEISPFTVKSEVIYIRLRRVVEDANDGDSDSSDEMISDATEQQPRFSFSYKKKFGGHTTSKNIAFLPGSTNFIDNTNPDNLRISWMLTAKNSTNYIRVRITNKNFLDISILDYHCSSPCLDPYHPRTIQELNEEGTAKNVKMYLVKSNVASILATNVVSSSFFTMDWVEVASGYFNSTVLNVTDAEHKEFNCGGDLTPIYDVQTFTLPTNEDGTYAVSQNYIFLVKSCGGDYSDFLFQQLLMP